MNHITIGRLIDKMRPKLHQTDAYSCFNCRGVEVYFDPKSKTVSFDNFGDMKPFKALALVAAILAAVEHIEGIGS